MEKLLQRIKSKTSVDSTSNYKSMKSKKSEEKDKNTNPKGKFIKLRYRGKETKVKFDEFMMVKGLDKQKLQASKDSMIQMMKRKKEFHKNQNDVYNMDILNNISINREEELRSAIISLQKEIRRKRMRSRDELEFLYNTILVEIKNIEEKATNEIEERKSELMDRIMLSIANCDYKQAQLLELKIKEQEDLFRHLHMFTFEMQQIRDNFDECLRRIKFLNESNYELKKNIFQEKLKFQHITSLMKEFKIRTNFMANKINNYRMITHRYEENIKNQINTEANKIRKKNIKLDINSNINNTRENKIRPLSTVGFFNNRITTATSGSGGSNYTPVNTNTNLENKILLNKEEDEKNELPLINIDNIDNVNLNDLPIIKTEGNIRSIKRERNSEQNIINVLKKDIEIYNNKILYVVGKYKEVIPDNEIYDSLTEIIEVLREDKNNRVHGEYNNNLVNNNTMSTLPVQNRQFRQLFVELLFRNQNIFEAIRNGQKNDCDKYFNKNLFGAEKISNK